MIKVLKRNLWKILVMGNVDKIAHAYATVVPERPVLKR